MLSGYDEMARDHRDACQWAHDLMSRKDWALIDTETSGLRGIVLEFAAIAPDGRELYNGLINPDGERIEESARRVHMISDAKLAAAPRLPEVWPAIHAALAGCTTLIAYNAAFDQARVKQSARRYGLPQLPQKWECAMEWYSQFCGDWNSYHQSYRWQKLPGAGHRAIEDARAALAVIREMAAEWERKYAPQGQLVLVERQASE